MAYKTLALLAQLDAVCTAADHLEAATIAAFQQHPDAEIYTSFPGVGPLIGARILAEVGDDLHRFPDARELEAYGGATPVTRASGKKTSVRLCRVKNDRLAVAGFRWAFCTLLPSPAPAPITIGAAPPEIGTPQPCETCSTSFSAACPTACRPERSTTRASRSQHRTPRSSRPPLDTPSPLDVLPEPSF